MRDWSSDVCSSDLRVTNTVCGGQAPTGESEGNTLDVHSYPGGSFINDFDAIQNLHFHVDNDAVSPVNPMLQLGIFAKDIRGLGIGVGISGGAKLLEIGETIRLLQTGGGALTTDADIENQLAGDHGVSLRYQFEIRQPDGDNTALVAIVRGRKMKDETK